MNTKFKNVMYFVNKMIIVSFLILASSIITVNAENADPTADTVTATEITSYSEEQETTSSEETNSIEIDNSGTMTDLPTSTPDTAEVNGSESNNVPTPEFHKGWIVWGDDWYYLDSDDMNSIHKGWLYTGGKWYCLDPTTGVMATGLQEIGNSKFYFASSGAMRTGWVLDGSNWYWLNNSGAMQTGWKFIGGNWYYFNLENGKMLLNGWNYIGKVDYKFGSSGAMVGCWMNVPCYNQFPELSTGCESVALTNLLNYYDFGLAKTTIASSYLPLTSGGNFVTAFSGNPFTGTGGLSGCVAPAIVNAGNNFLWTTGSSLRARDASFSSIQNIKDRLSNGQPVEVWNTESGGYPGGRYAVQFYNGHSYGLWGGNHAVVIKGYDDEQGIVYVSDSISGDVIRDAGVFFETWQRMDSQAVVIE